MKTKEEILNETGLNWKAESVRIQTRSGISIPDRIALVKSGTDKILGIHTTGYVPYQNDELLDLLFKIGNSTGLDIHTGGSFKDGELVWFQLKSDDMRIGNDTIKGYISGFNSFNGKSSLAFGNSNLTVSCMNTFWKGYSMTDTKLRHSISMKPRIEEILRKIDILLEEEKNTFKEIQKLTEIRMSPEVKQLVLQTLFDLENQERVGEISTNKKNKIERFENDLITEINSKGDNLWGLFSGVTRYTTHSMKKTDNSESKMFGRTGTLERKIYHDLVEMV